MAWNIEIAGIIVYEKLYYFCSFFNLLNVLRRVASSYFLDEPLKKTLSHI